MPSAPLRRLAALAVCCAGAASADAPSLSRIPPAEFEHRLSSIPLTLVLFCSPTVALCGRIEVEMATAAATLADEGVAISLHMVDTVEPGGDSVRAQYGVSANSPTMLLFRHGLASPYQGSRKADALVEAMRSVASGMGLSAGKQHPPAQKPPPSTPLPSAIPGDEHLQHLQQAGDPVAELSVGVEHSTPPHLFPHLFPHQVRTTAHLPRLLPPAVSFTATLEAQPLLFVLFYSAEHVAGTHLLSNSLTLTLTLTGRARGGHAPPL